MHSSSTVLTRALILVLIALLAAPTVVGMSALPVTADDDRGNDDRGRGDDDVNPHVRAAVLPIARAVVVGAPATAFVTLVNVTVVTAQDCRIVPVVSVPAIFVFQTTDRSSNRPVGMPNAGVNIAPGAAQTFVVAFTPVMPFAPTAISFNFVCANMVGVGGSAVNTLVLSASQNPVPDIVALSATLGNDGIVTIAGGSGVFAVATINVGSAGITTVTVDTQNVPLPVAFFICQTDAQGRCLTPPAPLITVMAARNATASFAIFVQARGAVEFEPEHHRIFVRFLDDRGVECGATSVAVRT